MGEVREQYYGQTARQSQTPVRGVARSPMPGKSAMDKRLAPAVRKPQLDSVPEEPRRFVLLGPKSPPKKVWRGWGVSPVERKEAESAWPSLPKVMSNADAQSETACGTELESVAVMSDCCQDWEEMSDWQAPVPDFDGATWDDTKIQADAWDDVQNDQFAVQGCLPESDAALEAQAQERLQQAEATIEELRMALAKAEARATTEAALRADLQEALATKKAEMPTRTAPFNKVGEQTSVKISFSTFLKTSLNVRLNEQARQWREETFGHL